MKKQAQVAFVPKVFLRALLAHLILERDEWVIVDIEAGLEHLGRSTAESIDYFLIVIEPGHRTLTPPKKINNLVGELGIRKISVVVNKVGSREEEDKIKEFLEVDNLTVLETLPWDSKLSYLDLEDKPVSVLDMASNFYQVVFRKGQKLTGQFKVG